MRFRLLGVEFTFSFWFFAVILGMVMLDRQTLALYFALPVLVHELGHLIMMKLCGATIRAVSFSALSIRIRKEGGLGLSYGQEIAISVGGVLANCLLALCLYLFCFQTMRMMFLVASNLAVALFNLMPIGDLDGGQLVRLISARLMGAHVSDWISRAASLLVLSILCGFAVFLLLIRRPNPTLLVMCGYLAFNILVRD